MSRFKASADEGTFDSVRTAPLFTFHVKQGGLSPRLLEVLDTQLRASPRLSVADSEFDVEHVESEAGPGYVAACREQLAATFRDASYPPKRTMDSWEDNDPTTGHEYRIHTGVWVLAAGDELHCFHFTVASGLTSTLTAPGAVGAGILFLQNDKTTDDAWETDDPYPDTSDLEGITMGDKFQTWVQYFPDLLGFRWLELVAIQPPGGELLVTKQGKMQTLFVKKDFDEKISSL